MYMYMPFSSPTYYMYMYFFYFFLSVSFYPLFSLFIINCLSFTIFSFSSRQTSDGNTVLLVDLNINNNNQSIIDEIFQFIGTKPEEAVSELYIHVHVHTSLW